MLESHGQPEAGIIDPNHVTGFECRAVDGPPLVNRKQTQSTVVAGHPASGIHDIVCYGGINAFWSTVLYGDLQKSNIYVLKGNVMAEKTLFSE